jgi:hypothetical protein
VLTEPFEDYGVVHCIPSFWSNQSVRCRHGSVLIVRILLFIIATCNAGKYLHDELLYWTILYTLYWGASLQRTAVQGLQQQTSAWLQLTNFTRLGTALYVMGLRLQGSPYAVCAPELPSSPLLFSWYAHHSPSTSSAPLASKALP